MRNKDRDKFDAAAGLFVERQEVHAVRGGTLTPGLGPDLWRANQDAG